MAWDEATALAWRINERRGGYRAAPFSVGSFALVLQEETGHGPSHAPILEVDRYLDLMDQGSTAVENDAVLRDVLRQWQAVHKAYQSGLL